MDRGTCLCVALLTVLAGCSGLHPSPPEPVSVTPAAVPEVGSTPTTPTATVASGRSPASSNYSAVASAHRSLLGTESYTVHASQTIRYPETGRRGERQLSGRFDAAGQFHAEFTRSGTVYGVSSPTLTRYYADDRQVLVLGGANGSDGVRVAGRDELGDPTDVLPMDPRFASELRQVFATTRVVNLTQLGRDGHPYQRVLVRVRGPVERPHPPPLVTTTVIRNLSATLVIDERGFVQRFSVRYEAWIGGQPAIVTLSARYEAVGDTTVERPAWAERALQGRSPGNATATVRNATR